MSYRSRSLISWGASALVCAVTLAACGESNPTRPVPAARSSAAAQSWGPETPHFNLELILRNPDGTGGARGNVKFRQPNDENLIIYIDVSIRGLAPNTHYQLQRAADPFDGVCTSTSWLTLGQGSVAHDIVTDADGNASESLFRQLPNPVGSKFDIRMRIVAAGTTNVVLATDCYEFTVSR